MSKVHELGLYDKMISETATDNDQFKPGMNIGQFLWMVEMHIGNQQLMPYPYPRRA